MTADDAHTFRHCFFTFYIYLYIYSYLAYISHIAAFGVFNSIFFLFLLVFLFIFSILFFIFITFCYCGCLSFSYFLGVFVVVPLHSKLFQKQNTKNKTHTRHKLTLNEFVCVYVLLCTVS